MSQRQQRGLFVTALIWCALIALTQTPVGPIFGFFALFPLGAVAIPLKFLTSAFDYEMNEDIFNLVYFAIFALITSSLVIIGDVRRRSGNLSGAYRYFVGAISSSGASVFLFLAFNAFTPYIL